MNEYHHYSQTKQEIEQTGSDKQLEIEVAVRHWQASGKLRVLMNFLRDWIQKDPTTKVLIFSQTKKVLDII